MFSLNINSLLNEKTDGGVIQNKSDSSSSSFPVALSGAKATNKHPPVIMVLGQSLLQFSPHVAISPHGSLYM